MTVRWETASLRAVFERPKDDVVSEEEQVADGVAWSAEREAEACGSMRADRGRKHAARVCKHAFGRRRVRHRCDCACRCMHVQGRQRLCERVVRMHEHVECSAEQVLVHAYGLMHGAEVVGEHGTGMWHAAAGAWHEGHALRMAL